MPYSSSSGSYNNGWNAGGFNWLNNKGTTGENEWSLSGWMGRLWNNLSGTTANNQYNQLEAEKARTYNSAEAEADRNFQEYMSNTAYQRAAADMKAAGINPASLSGDGSMSPAVVPQGSRANSAQATSTVNGGNGLLDLAKSALSIALFKKFGNTATKAPTAKAAVENVSKSATSAVSAAKTAAAIASNIKKSDWNLDFATQKIHRYSVDPNLRLYT